MSQAILALAAERQVQIEARAGVPGPPPLEITGDSAVYLTPFYYGEIGVANRLRAAGAGRRRRTCRSSTSFDWPTAFRRCEIQTRLALSERQSEAVRTALTHRVAVLTGGPGTGKTTTVRSIIRLVEAAGQRALLASPTGRAAKRLTEATGRPAKTIHRLLEFKPGEGFTFQRNEDKPAGGRPADRGRSLDAGSAADQQPAQGHAAGHASAAGGRCRPVAQRGRRQRAARPDRRHRERRTRCRRGARAVVRLDTIFRQPGGSHIITNAHRINHGQLPTIDNRNSRDFFLFKEEDPERAAALIVELVQERIPRQFGLRARPDPGAQPHAPWRGRRRRAEQPSAGGLNPPRAGHCRATGRRAHVSRGDRVMQIRNNYDKEVYNGDMGYVQLVDPGGADR